MAWAAERRAHRFLTFQGQEVATVWNPWNWVWWWHTQPQDLASCHGQQRAREGYGSGGASRAQGRGTRRGSSQELE